MSSQGQRNGERVIHQDFIARIRYSNALPPPPNPPKLLDIPNTGLASGQYTTPGFASRLARDQPLNIEADAELGMPLDLVGMPGVFDGDESSIQAPSQAPPVHPHDRALLRPLATLGKPKVAGANVSFLRRTEYISANTATKSSAFRQAPKNNIKRPPKRKSPEPEAGTPAYIKRKIEKGFEAAQQNLKDKSQIRHPVKLPVGKNKSLKVVEAFPVLPDLDAFPDSGTYVTYKFAHPPIPGDGAYDKRLLHSILKYVNRTEEEEEEYKGKLDLHQRDPETYPKPPNQMRYAFYVTENVKYGENFKQKFDLHNPNRDDEGLNPEVKTEGGKPWFEFHYNRSYNCTIEYELGHDTKYSEELIFGVDPDTKVAWYYPLMQRSKLEPPRRIYSAITGSQRKKTEVDELDMMPVDPPEELRHRIARWKADPRVPIDQPDDEEEEEEEVHGDVDGEAEEVDSQNGDSSRRDESEEPVATNSRGHSEPRYESEQDAEGDED